MNPPRPKSSKSQAGSPRGRAQGSRPQRPSRGQISAVVKWLRESRDAYRAEIPIATAACNRARENLRRAIESPPNAVLSLVKIARDDLHRAKWKLGAIEWHVKIANDFIGYENKRRQSMQDYKQQEPGMVDTDSGGSSISSSLHPMVVSDELAGLIELNRQRAEKAFYELRLFQDGVDRRKDEADAAAHAGRVGFEKGMERLHAAKSTEDALLTHSEEIIKMVETYDPVEDYYRAPLPQRLEEAKVRGGALLFEHTWAQHEWLQALATEESHWYPWNQARNRIHSHKIQQCLWRQRLRRYRRNMDKLDADLTVALEREKLYQRNRQDQRRTQGNGENANQSGARDGTDSQGTTKRKKKSVGFDAVRTPLRRRYDPGR